MTFHEYFKYFTTQRAFLSDLCCAAILPDNNPGKRVGETGVIRTNQRPSLVHVGSELKILWYKTIVMHFIYVNLTCFSV